ILATRLRTYGRRLRELHPRLCAPLGRCIPGPRSQHRDQSKQTCLRDENSAMFPMAGCAGFAVCLAGPCRGFTLMLFGMTPSLLPDLGCRESFSHLLPPFQPHQATDWSTVAHV